MSSITIGFVLVRLAAIFLFVRGVQGLSTYSYFLADFAAVPMFAVITLVFSVMLPIGVAYLLWQQPEKVTGAEHSSGKPSGPLGPDQVLLIGISLLGLYLLIYGILDLLRIEAMHRLQLQIAVKSGLPVEYDDPGVLTDRLVFGLQVLLGLCMVVGRQRLAGLLFRVKYAAVQAPGTRERDWQPADRSVLEK